MFAISVDIRISSLEQYYGKPYNSAYWEIKDMLSKHNFYWIQGSTYMTQSDDMSTLFEALDDLRHLEWFRKSVRDIRGFKVENWSDFTHLVKQE